MPQSRLAVRSGDYWQFYSLPLCSGVRHKISTSMIILLQNLIRLLFSSTTLNDPSVVDSLAEVSRMVAETFWINFSSCRIAGSASTILSQSAALKFAAVLTKLIDDENVPSS